LGGKSISDRLEEFGDAARARMLPGFEAAGVAYPPAELTLVAVKSERMLYVYAGAGEGRLEKVLSYTILGQSGDLGPKLREGDLQVPEGLYKIEGLNPNSNYHVSLRVNYPNDFDRQKARAEGRDRPGSDIYIHGRSASVGCLAMGNPVAEELFTLAVDVGPKEVNLIITPVDFREDGPYPGLPEEPAWLSALYGEIEAVLRSL